MLQKGEEGCTDSDFERSGKKMKPDRENRKRGKSWWKKLGQTQLKEPEEAHFGEKSD